MQRPLIEVQCQDLNEALAFYTEELDYRLDIIFPADNPRMAELRGDGILLRLEQPPSTVHRYADESGEWHTGRAGMLYRDLLPGRLGGKFIASHIRIPTGGPVPDYVHHHDVRFQMIYCHKGWVKVVYEDYGAPFTMEAGDCVLQPPHIRHRVLAASDGLEVIEVGTPAEHETLVDHDLELPSGHIDRERTWDGQHFLFHRFDRAHWSKQPQEEFDYRDTGISEATDGLASAWIVRPHSDTWTVRGADDSELHLCVLLRGTADSLAEGDSFHLEAGREKQLTGLSKGAEFLQVNVRK